MLSGDLLGNDNDNLDVEEPTRAENSLHVVVAEGGTYALIVLDGFTVSSGHDDVETLGGGLFIRNGLEVNLSNVVFRANVAARCGGAIFNDGSQLKIIHARFYENLAAGDIFCGGGALHQERGTVRVHDVHFENNTGDVGGALSIFAATTLVTESPFIANHSGFGGGAVFLNQVSEETTAVLANVLFLGNMTSGSGGGALFNEHSEVTLINAVFSGNVFTQSEVYPFNKGGAIVNIEGSEVMLVNSTLAGNKAPSGSALHNGNSTLMLRNSIVWGNQNEKPGAASISYAGNQPLEIGRTLVEGGLPLAAIDGGGNIFTDPLFIDADGPDDIPGTLDDDLRLRAGSPAIDAGDTSALPADSLDLDRDSDMAELLPIDLLYNRRVFDGGSDAAVVDMGVYEFGAPPVRVVVEPPKAEIPETLPPPEGYPNPFQHRATLRYVLPEAGRVVLAVYDVLGRHVATLVDRVQAAGPHQVRFEVGPLPSGLYLYRIEAAEQSHSGRLLLVK